MAYSIAIGGNTLYRVRTDGTLGALTLPSGITIDTTRRPRFAILGKTVIITNGLTRSISVDPNFIVRPLQLQAPVSPVILSSAAAGNLSGNFVVWQTYKIKDPLTGALIAESDFGPASAASGAFTSKLLKADGIAASPDTATTHIGMYRSLTGPGSVKFPWLDIDGNFNTSVSDDLADAALQIIAAPTTLGPAAGLLPNTFMTQLVEWKGRLWGVGDGAVDDLIYSDLSIGYAWPSANVFKIPPLGADQFGVTGLIPRKDELGVARRKHLWKITGDYPNFERIKASEGGKGGVLAPESVVVIDDIGYFLAENAVMTWGPNGIKSISDGRVRNWFASGKYFNKATLPNAFGRFNSEYYGYELFGTMIDGTVGWVFYDIQAGKWWGPHRTSRTTPTAASGQIVDANNVTIPVLLGADGIIYLCNQKRFDDDGQAIVLEGELSRHSNGTPDVEKLFKEPTVVFGAQAAAGNLKMLCKAGTVKAGVTRTFKVDQTVGNGRERFPPIGNGRFCGVVFTEDTATQGCEIQGYEIPVHELGRR